MKYAWEPFWYSVVTFGTHLLGDIPHFLIFHPGPGHIPIKEHRLLRGFCYFHVRSPPSMFASYADIVCEKLPTRPQLPVEFVFLTPTTCIIRHDFVFECAHCLSHLGGSQIATPASR